MALRAVKPEKVQKRLKALFYGGAGSGKSTAAASFPYPYFIDTERGIENDQYVKLLTDNGGVVFQTTDFDELVNEVKSLLSEKHEYKTLVIDPFTTLYNDLLDKAALQVGTTFGAHYGLANKKVKHLLNLLLRLDMSVIITCHSKNEYGQNLAILGQTYDGYKKLEFLFDLCIEVQKRGKDRIGIIKKSRIESLPDGETFPFSYEEIAKRYGKEMLEKESVPQILASQAQVSEINRLIDLIKVPQESIDKWLKKAESTCFEEMQSDTIEKCINHLKDKIEGNGQ